MDTISAQEIPSQQIPIQPEATFKKGSFRKFFNLSSWIVLFALLPITILIFLSQDSIPGDLFYPVKRGMENVILAAASVNPATRAAFRTDLTEARFKEAQSLVVSKSNAGGLSTFVDEVQSIQLEVVSLKSDTERKKAEEKLLVKIEKYQSGLSTLEAKTEQNIIAYQFQEIPSPTTIPRTSVTNLPSAAPTFALTSTLTPTTTLMPTSTPVKQASSASSEASAPTVAKTSPTVPPQPENTQVLEQKKIAQTLKETKEQLDKIKKDLEENRRENKENREKRNENEKNDSSNRQK